MPAVRLLPLETGGPNEIVANKLARLLCSAEADTEAATHTALLILTALQAFLDSGDARAVDALWEPLITAQRLSVEFGEEAWRQAAGRAGAAKAMGNERDAWIYERAAVMLAPEPAPKP